VGGGELVGQFADRGLLDEIILGVAPVTLGAGKPVAAATSAGKTSLTERLLYLAGVIDEVGSVDDGSTRTDTMAWGGSAASPSGPPSPAATGPEPA
jgi:hypothetical protein